MCATEGKAQFLRVAGTQAQSDVLVDYNQVTNHKGGSMASPQNSNQMKESEVEYDQDERFDQETRKKSADALFSLLTHLKRQDEESSSK